MSVKAFGSQAATVGTEHTLLDTSDAGVYLPNVDLTNLAADDLVELRVSKKYASGGAYVLVMPPVVFGPTVPGAPGTQFIGYDAPYGFKFTLKQTAGTGRTFPWYVSQLDV